MEQRVATSPFHGCSIPSVATGWKQALKRTRIYTNYSTALPAGIELGSRGYFIDDIFKTCYVVYLYMLSY